MANIETIQSRLRERLATLGLSARSVSIAATGKADAINNILNKRANPSWERLQAIANEMGTSATYLTGMKDSPAADPWDVAEGGPRIPNPFDMPKDIPVYGSVLAGVYNLEGAETAPELTTLNRGEVIDFFRRPPALLTNLKIYGLYISGSSMEPAFESGNAVIVDPIRPPSIRDFVVVYLVHRGDEAILDWPDSAPPSLVLLKRLVRRSASFVELEQFNPAGTFRVPTAEISQMHRVVTTAEMLGI